MKSVKILIVNYMETTDPGGINKVVFETGRGLSEMGHEVTVFNPAWDKKKEYTEEKIGKFRIVRGSAYNHYLFGFSLENTGIVKKIVERIKPELVHVHGYHNLFSPTTILGLKRSYRKTPVIFSPHLDIARSTIAGIYLWSLYNFVIGKRVFKEVDFLISPSKFEADILRFNHGVSPDRIAIIPHGVDSICNESISNPADMVRIIYTGYLIRRKRVDLILLALHSLIYDLGVKNAHLFIIGDGPERRKLGELARTLKITENITWKSFLPHGELLNEIRKSNVFLLLSESEAYGISVAEALAMGIPAIVSKRTALNEFLSEPGCFGVDFPPDPKKVAELILNIAKSHVRVGPFSKKIRRWDEVVKDYEGVYETVLRGKRR